MDVVDAVKAQFPGDSLLETLENARHSIAAASIDRDASWGLGSWEFQDWSRCTCGHIYGAALGSQGEQHAVTNSQDKNYVEALRAIAETLNPEWDWSHADVDEFTSYVSEQTGVAAKTQGNGTQEGALWMLDETIQRIKEEQEQDRLNLLKALGEMDADGETVTPDPSDPESQPGPAAPDDAPEVDPQEQPAQEPQATA